MLPKFKAALFDMDGTLLCTMRYWRFTTLELLLQLDIIPTPEQLGLMYSTSSRKFCMEILKELRNFSTGEYMFPSRGRGTHISREGLERVLPSIGIDPKKMSIHGFRSIFRSLGMKNDFPEHSLRSS